MANKQHLKTDQLPDTSDLENQPVPEQEKPSGKPSGTLVQITVTETFRYYPKGPKGPCMVYIPGSYSVNADIAAAFRKYGKGSIAE